MGSRAGLVTIALGVMVGAAVSAQHERDRLRLEDLDLVAQLEAHERDRPQDFIGDHLCAGALAAMRRSSAPTKGAHLPSGPTAPIRPSALSAGSSVTHAYICSMRRGALTHTPPARS